MLGPLTLEVLAIERVREHLAQARAAELAAQLPPTERGAMAAVARRQLARALRGLAARLDPSFTPGHSRLARA
jgi:hypothetical protein